MKNWKFWLGLLVTVVFLFLVLRGLDFQHTLTALKEANYWLIVPALVAYFAGVWVRSMRWQVLLRPLKQITSRQLFPVVVIGYMANDVLPARIGEFVRAYVLGKREGVPASGSLATIAVERIFDGLVMILFMLVASLAVPLTSELVLIVRLALGIFLGLLVILFALAFIPRLADFAVSLLGMILPGGLGDKASGILRSFINGLGCLRNPRQLVAVLVLSIGAWVLEATMYYIIAGAFSLSLPFYGAILTTAVANLATLLPSSPGYVGPFEAGAMLVLSGVFGMVRETAMSYVIVLHAVLYLPVTLLGLFYWFRESLSWRELRGLEKASSATKEPSLT